MHRYREPLTSFLASAILTTSLLPVPGAVSSLASVVDPAAARRALSLAMAHAPAGFTPAAADSVPGAVVAPTPVSVPTQPIRPEKLKAIIDATLAGDKIYPVSEQMAVGLGMTFPFMSKNARIDVGATRHSLAVGVMPADRLIFLRRTPEMMRLYATDRSAKLLAAGIIVNGVFTAVPLDQARASFEEELRQWDSAINEPPTTVTAMQSNS